MRCKACGTHLSIPEETKAKWEIGDGLCSVCRWEKNKHKVKKVKGKLKKFSLLLKKV